MTIALSPFFLSASPLLLSSTLPHSPYPSIALPPRSICLPLCGDLIILQGDAALGQMHGCKLGEG